MQINLRVELEKARRRFDSQLAKVLLSQPELSHAQIEKQFGISTTVIRRVIKQFNIPGRKRGPKPSTRSGSLRVHSQSVLR
jgi:hypothetical protein